jgi:type IV pilus assembly protein PilB
MKGYMVPVDPKTDRPAAIRKIQGRAGYGEIVDLLLEDGAVSSEQVAYAARVHAKLSNAQSMLSVLKELGAVTEDRIREIIRANLKRVHIGGLLIELGLIANDDLQVALALQAASQPRLKLGEILVQHNLVDEGKLIEVLALQLGYPIEDPEFAEIDRRLFDQGPVAFYQKHNFVPICADAGKVRIAFADPMDIGDIDAARECFGPNLEPAIAAKGAIQRTIQKFLAGAAATARGGVSDERSPEQIVRNIFIAALQAGNVSDVHLEPLRDRLRVRFRQDGVLQHHRDFTKDLIAGVTSRIKVLCEADIAEKPRHQGGRLIFDHDGTAVDMCVSIYVTVHGEQIVLRLLNRKNDLLKIEDIGLGALMLERFQRDALDCPGGVILITGPTDSGKTTTVYSCIDYLDKPETSIITAEEPVEFFIDGIAQCAINPKIDLTFEETLRHIVRQDSDVIVIGEIGDAYSAEVAVQAALTGRKVLAALHAEDSIGGLVRLINMNIDAFLISSTLVCVVAQRLLRRTCPDCAAAYAPTARDMLLLGYTPKDIDGAAFRRGRGCPHCQHTGYRGRVAVFEMLVLNELVRNAILDKKTSHQIRQIGIDTTGLVTLLEDGLAKAAAGATTIDEVLRVLPRMQKPRPLADIQRLSGSM